MRWPAGGGEAAKAARWQSWRDSISAVIVNQVRPPRSVRTCAGLLTAAAQKACGKGAVVFVIVSDCGGAERLLALSRQRRALEVR